MGQGLLNCVVFLGLAKAFDSVCQDRFFKLYSYGVNEKISSFFKSYLHNRRQKCWVNGYLSNERSLNCGVPKSLGVHIDERLSWLDDIDNIPRTVSVGISGLRQKLCFLYKHPLLHIVH